MVIGFETCEIEIQTYYQINDILLIRKQEKFYLK